MVRPDPCTLSPYDYPRAARWTEAFKRIVFSDVEEWHNLLAMRNLVATLTTRNVFNYPWSLEVFTDESYRNLVSVRAKSRIILSYGQVVSIIGHALCLFVFYYDLYVCLTKPCLIFYPTSMFGTWAIDWPIKKDKPI